MDPVSTSCRNWPSDTAALLELGEDPSRSENWWTVNHAFQGLQAFGATGSGKTSGPGRALAEAFLESNFGGLVLTAKTDERAEWEKLAKKYGREHDLLIFGEGQPFRFNFLKYERTREGKGAGNTENLTNLFMSIMEAADRKNRGGGDSYWTRAVQQLLRNAFDLLIIATGNEAERYFNLLNIYKIITSAPSTTQELESASWQQYSTCYKMLQFAKARAGEIGRQADFEITYEYWTRDFAQLAIETKTAVVSMFTSMADSFLRGTLREMFCGELNIYPEDTFKGKIIILDFPIKEYYQLGAFAQILFKYLWQRAVERRIPPGISRHEAQETIRPVFLYADESQFFCNSHDALFQATARSSRACTVYLTQNLPGYESAFMSEGGKPAAEAFIANLSTKVFCSNGDPATNNWAAESIGRARQIQISGGLAHGERQGSSQQSTSGSIVIEHLVQSHEFTTLRTGGAENDGIVDCIIFQGGRQWLGADGKKTITRNYLRHSFKQPKE